MSASSRSVSCCSDVVSCVVPSSLSAQAQSTGIREVSASARSLIPLQTRLRYTTMIVLPEGEEILDVICGDKDFWVISATHNIAHVKPAKEGAATNLNLVTASGAVYSFLLTEKNGAATPDLKVYVNADPNAPQGKPKYYSAAQVEALQAELTEAQGRGGRGEPARDRVDRRVPAAVSRRSCSSSTARRKYEKPFLVRSIWHDGQFTYIKADATELPALYEVKDGKPALVNFQVQEGTYVVPKVLDEGYLALGKERFDVLAAGAVRYGRDSSCREHRPRPAAGNGHGPSPRSARRAAPRRADLADGRPRRRHAGDHADRRTARSAGAASDGGRARAASERRPRSRLSGPPARCSTRRRCETHRLAAPAPSVQPVPYDDPQPPPPQDPIAADRKRREYESLFASNVVLSRRPENERPGRRPATRRKPMRRARTDRREPVGRRGRGRRRARHEREPPASPSNSAAQFPPQAPAPLRAVIAVDRSSAELRTRRRRSAPPARCTACSKARSSTPC